MFSNRHCTYSDYRLLVDSGDHFLSLLKTNDKDCLENLDSFLDLIRQFDNDIASQIYIVMVDTKLEKEQKYNRVSEIIESLKRNVLVDIQEHA